jgi:hypothetical protein
VNPKQLVADGCGRLYNVYASWGGAEGQGLRRHMVAVGTSEVAGRHAPVGHVT